MGFEVGLSRKGQAMIFVLVALVLVVGLVVFFFLRGGEGPSIGLRQGFHPQGFLEQCVRENVEDVVEVMIPQGGFVNPEHAASFDGREVTFHCYTRGSYFPCVQQHPMLLSELPEEIRDKTFDAVKGCYTLLDQEVTKRKGTLSVEEITMNVDVVRDKILLNLIGRTTITIDGGTVSFDTFEMEVRSPLYRLANVAMEIASQEAKYCYFSTDGYSLLYKEFDVQKHVLEDNVHVYTIEDKPSGQEFSLAIRSCAIPPGI